MSIINKIEMSLTFLILFSFTEKIYSQYTIYTPEGCSVNAMVLSGTPYYTNEWAQYWIDYYSLDATIIKNPTRAYNCHGYAWSVTEGIGNYWIEDDEELKYFTDGSYSNDGQPSYITASQANATHGCYEPYSDHSIRVIQNGYPVSSSGSQTQVSKWNDGPLVRHGLRGDVYAAFYAANHNNNPIPINFRKLKTTHYGTLTNYQKTWIGAGGKTHTVSSNIECPNTLTIKSGASVNLNNYYIRCEGTGKIVNNGTISGYKHYAKSGSDYKAFFPSTNTIQQSMNLASSGWSVYIGSGTYTENISMKAGVDVVGSGQSSTTIVGTVTFSDADYASLSNLAVNNKITVSSSNDVDISSVKAGGSSCYIEATNSSWVNLSSFNSTVLQTRGVYAHANSEVDLASGTIKNKYDGVHLEYSSADMVWTQFCQNITSDIYAYQSTAWCMGCQFSSPTPGGSVIGDVTWTSWDWCGMYKSAGDKVDPGSPEMSTPNDGVDPAENDYQVAMEEYKNLKETIQEEKNKREGFDFNAYASEFAGLINQFRQIVTKYPDSPYAVFSLQKMAALWRVERNFESLAGSMQAIANNPTLSAPRPHALGILISQCM